MDFGSRPLRRAPTEPQVPPEVKVPTGLKLAPDVKMAPAAPQTPALAAPTPGLSRVFAGQLKRAVDEAQQHLVAAGRLAADGPRVTLPAPELSRSARLAGDRALARWRELFGLEDGMLPPVGRPADLKARLVIAFGDRKRPAHVERMLAMLTAFDREGWAECGVPELVSATKGTFYASRKYVVRAATDAAMSAVKFFDRGSAVEADMRRQLSTLEAANALLRRYPPDPDGLRARDRNSWGSSLWHRVEGVIYRNRIERPKVSTDKQPMLNKLNRLPDWRGRFFSTVLAHYSADADAVAVMMCAGPRPLELVNGVRISYSTADDQVHLTTEGVKLKRGGKPPRDEKGQAERQVWVARDTPESRHLASLAKSRGAVDGRTHLVRVERGAPEASPEARALAWKDAVFRFGRRAFGADLDGRLSPYVFRHAFSANLKAQGALTDEEIAAAMGHLSRRTASGYGIARQAGSSRGPSVGRASASSPVRGARSGYRVSGFPR